jgi:hypothetical protein
MVIFTLRQLKPQGKSSLLPLDRRLDGLQSQHGDFAEALALAGN